LRDGLKEQTHPDIREAEIDTVNISIQSTKKKQTKIGKLLKNHRHLIRDIMELKKL